MATEIAARLQGHHALRSGDRPRRRRLQLRKARRSPCGPQRGRQDYRRRRPARLAVAGCRPRGAVRRQPSPRPTASAPCPSRATCWSGSPWSSGCADACSAQRSARRPTCWATAALPLAERACERPQPGRGRDRRQPPRPCAPYAHRRQAGGHAGGGAAGAAGLAARLRPGPAADPGGRGRLQLTATPGFQPAGRTDGRWPRRHATATG